MVIVCNEICFICVKKGNKIMVIWIYIFICIDFKIKFMVVGEVGGGDGCLRRIVV